MVWLGPVVLTLVIIGLLIWPLARPRAPAATATPLDLYKAQLAELDADQRAGRLDDGAAAAARLDIERRILALPTAAPAPPRSSPAGRIIAVSTLVAVPLLAAYVYRELGSPGLADRPLAGRAAELALLAPDGSLDREKARAALTERLGREPDSIEGWLLLGRTDLALGRTEEAHDAYDKALTLGHRSADLLEAVGEAWVEANDGTVDTDAATLFAEAAAKSPTAWVARYDLALAKAEAGDFAGAIAGWQAIERDAPADAPFRDAVKNSIAEAERRRDGKAAPPPDTGRVP